MIDPRLGCLSAAGGDAISHVPALRWDASDHVSAQSYGGFIHSAQAFDTSFFWISSVETAAITTHSRPSSENTHNPDHEAAPVDQDSPSYMLRLRGRGSDGSSQFPAIAPDATESQDAAESPDSAQFLHAAHQIADAVMDAAGGGETLIQQLTTAEFWAPLGREALHWLHPQLWTGWTMPTAHPISSDHWTPWHAVVDSAHAPVVRWFVGGLTSAALNELDRQVLRGHGKAIAFVSDTGGASEQVSMHELLIEASFAASALCVLCAPEDSSNGGVDPPTVLMRMAIYLPNDLSAITWISAAKRVAMPYVAVASGTASSSLANRLADTAAVLLVTSEALVPVAEGAFQVLEEPPKGLIVPAVLGSHDTRASPANGFTHMASALRSAHGGFLATWCGAADDLCGAALVAALWRLREPSPVEANFPLFILYTSGSTGKPKGIVHTHGGYQLGLCATSQAVFALQPAVDVFFVIATPGWITGQSYMIAASLLCRVPSVRIRDRSSHPPAHPEAMISHSAAIAHLDAIWMLPNFSTHGRCYSRAHPSRHPTALPSPSSATA